MVALFATSTAAVILQTAGCSKQETRVLAKSSPRVDADAANKPAATADASQVVAEGPAKLSFNEHIQPILAENCYACHGADAGSRKGELRLDRAEFAFADRKDKGPAIVKGDPGKSPLVQRIESTNPKEMMPPPEAHKTLKPADVALLRQWVTEGAEYQEHWSFLAPIRKTPPALPAAKEKFVRNPIDRFILARLAREGLEPSPEADPRALIRRVSLDLTGLPPNAAEIEAFLADKAPGAYERVVDRLLASPRFGEHRARYWLDYVRYADTHGIHFDNYRAIWPYRDYVIRAFNQDKPFDRFVREQLAGDLLPAKTLDEIAATGLMRCNPTTNEGGTVTEEVFVNQTRDRVEAFGVTFLGLTTGCAACHDHKFDPISQKDFHGLAAFLSNTAEKPWDLNIADPGPVLRLPKEKARPAVDVLLGMRADLQSKLDVRKGQSLSLVSAWLAAGNQPKVVPTEALELRLKLDEGSGDVLKNSAPGKEPATFKADTNPLVWGENSWLWPSMRMDIFTRINLGNLGDVDAEEKFSAGSWLFLRAKPGGGVRSGTGSGSLLSRMGDEKRKGGAGWEIYQEGGQFTVNLVAVPEALAPVAPAPAATAEPGASVADTAKKPPAANDVVPAVAPKPPVKRGITVTTRGTFLRDEWLHVFFTYDGSRQASGLKIYVNGKAVDTDVKLNTLGAGLAIRTDASMHLGRRDDFMPMRETRYQDVRFYRRALPPAEVARLPFGDLAAEIVARQPDPGKWTRDEKFVAVDRFFLGEVDKEAMELAAAVEGHDGALQALTKDGEPTLIAVEKSTPAYSDVLKRGDYFARAERVGPSTPHFLPPLPANAPENRLGLANWLLSAEQPMFSRVTVNRSWQEIFGTGLVESSGDFGIMGARPSHPDLLDWLAVEFRESGWDVKKFYRLLVTSATYRQSSKNTQPNKDPANRLLARGPRFRMDGEMLRDSALAAAGLLVEKVGGPSVRPYQPPGLWEEVAMPESNTKTYVPDTGEGLYRRSVYTFWKRASAPASMETFDATSREVVCTRRARTNTPLQAFVTMNDPQWVEAARKLAERALLAQPAEAARLEFIAQAALGRPLEPKENDLVRVSIAKYGAHFQAQENSADAGLLLSVGESKVDPALKPVEVAQWTMVASQFLNLDEFFTK